MCNKETTDILALGEFSIFSDEISKDLGNLENRCQFDSARIKGAMDDILYPVDTIGSADSRDKLVLS